MKKKESPKDIFKWVLFRLVVFVLVLLVTALQIGLFLKLLTGVPLDYISGFVSGGAGGSGLILLVSSFLNDDNN